MRITATLRTTAAVALALGLAACSTATSTPAPSASAASTPAASVPAAGASQAAASASAAAPSAAPVALTMSGWSDDKTMDALIAGYQTANPGVTVKHTGLPWPDILTTINTQLVSGTASDIVVVFPGNGNPITVQTLAKGSYLADLSSAGWASKFSSGTKSVMSAGGKVLMASDNSGIIPAIYNQAALTAVGATPPTTWTQVLALCSTAKAQGKVAYALGGATGGNMSHYLYALTATLVYADGTFAQNQAAGTATFSGSKWEQAITQLLQMRDAGCFSKNPLGTTIDVAQKQVATGDALGIVTVSQQISTIQKLAATGANFVSAPLPATDSAADTVLPVGLGAGYGVNAGSKNADAAAKFLDYYMSDEGLNIAVTVGSNFPSIPLAGYTPSAVLAGVAIQAQSGKTAPYPDQLWPNSVVNQVYLDQMQQVFGNKTTIAAALTAMDAAYKQ